MAGVVRFYHVEGTAEGAAAATAVDAVLPRLLEKILHSGQQVLVLCPHENRASRLDEVLWTANPESFLPHVLIEKEHPLPPERVNNQAVLLSTLEDPSWPALLSATRLPLLLAGTESALPQALQTLQAHAGTAPLLYLFSAVPAAVQVAREQWQNLKKAGHALEYWQQTEGKWQRRQVSPATTPAAV